jgi:hypothetical protein
MTIKLIESKKVFLVAALLVVITLSFFAVAYAEVTVGSLSPLQDTIMYNLDNAKAGTWNTTLAPNGPSTPWYSRLEVNIAGHNGAITINWKLQQKTDSFSWTDITGAATSTSLVLSGNVQTVYATSDGSYSSSNYDWGQNITASGTYRVVVTILAQD